MSDEPKAQSTMIGPQLIGIAAAAVMFVAAMRTDRVPDDVGSPFQRAARQLRIGMTPEEARAAMRLPVELSKPALAGSNSHLDTWYHDPHSSELLMLHFDKDGDRIPFEFQYSLTKWVLRR
jgi:hypothetical protein